MIGKRWVCCLALLLSVGAANMKKPDYPASRVENVVEKLHGVEVADPYRWLENAESKEVLDWVEAQNKFTRAMLDEQPGREKIRERLGQLLDVGVVGTPIPRKGRYFYTRREGKQNQPVLYVRQGLNGKDEVVVDPNVKAEDGTVALDWWFPSRDGRYVAYGLSQDGSEQSTLYIRDVVEGKDLPDQIDRTRFTSLAWTPDSQGFYYTRYPKKGSVPAGQENYNKHVFYHRLGSDPEKDVKVFGEGRAAEDMPGVALSPNGRWLVVSEHQGWAKNEVYFKDLNEPNSEFRPLVEKITANFDVLPRDDVFWVRTNHDAPRYKLYRVDPAKPDRKDWTEILPEGPDVLDDVVVIGKTLVCKAMVRASSRLRLHELDGKLRREIKLPTLGSVSGLGGEWNGKELLYGFQSFTAPSTIYHVALDAVEDKAGEPTLWAQVKADIDFTQYVVDQVAYKSKDGTEITMFLAHKKGLERDGKNPTVLYGYGGFNISLTPAFAASRFLFLERGGVFAIPNLRGGGEYGEEWHKAGMLDKKQNVFDDFLAAADWLVANKITTRDRLAIQGGSNGGLLVGAALTQRPDAFRAVVCQVPLLDMVRYHKFLIARLWIPEYGSADDPEQFKWLHAYSPYHQVQDGTAYPAVFLVTAQSDTRVDALHARKMAARLQAATSGEQPILLRLETKAGHGAGKPRAKVLDELVDVWTFLFWQLGVKA